MRELEFLPDWYPRIARQKRLLVLQAWLGGLVLATLGLWTFLAGRNIGSATAALATLDRQLLQSRGELRQLDEQKQLGAALKRQEEVVARIGLPIDMTRLIRTLDSLAPAEMSLLELNCETVESLRSVQAVARSKGAESPLDRTLRVKVIAVAPSDVTLSAFLEALSGARQFENVAMAYARDRQVLGRIVREFEVNFSVRLDETVTAEVAP